MCVCVGYTIPYNLHKNARAGYLVAGSRLRHPQGLGSPQSPAPRRNLRASPAALTGVAESQWARREAGQRGRRGGISRAAARRLERAARAATAAAPVREGGSGSAATGGRARGAVGGCRVSCRRPLSATMPGIDKLPIEETLEDSPQVRRGRRCEAREKAGRADPRPGSAAAAGARPGPGGSRSPVSPPVAGRAPSRHGPAASPRPAWACTAGPRGTRGVWDVGGRRPNLRCLRSWARRSRTFAGLPYI